MSKCVHPLFFLRTPNHFISFGDPFRDLGCMIVEDCTTLSVRARVPIEAPSDRSLELDICELSVFRDTLCRSHSGWSGCTRLRLLDNNRGSVGSVRSLTGVIRAAADWCTRALALALFTLLASLLTEVVHVLLEFLDLGQK